MLSNPRTWLYVAGGWLIVAGLAHFAAHTWTVVLENGMVGLRDFAMNAMKQARSPDPLQPSLWRQFRLFSVSFGLLLIFSGSVNVVLAWTRAPRTVVQAVTLFSTIFWTVAFVPFAFIDPVIQPIVIAAIAVPLHAIVYVTASVPPEGEPSGRSAGDR